MPEDQWDPDADIGCIWLICPGLLLAHELYGLIYADLGPGLTTVDGLLPLRLAEPGGRAARRPCPAPPRWRPGPPRRSGRTSWCGRAAAGGCPAAQHGYELIGRNEKGVQLFHETLARQTGYPGLRYV